MINASVIDMFLVIENESSEYAFCSFTNVIEGNAIKLGYFKPHAVRFDHMYLL